jgi:hypothetical protein
MDWGFFFFVSAAAALMPSGRWRRADGRSGRRGSDIHLSVWKRGPSRIEGMKTFARSHAWQAYSNGAISVPDIVNRKGEDGVPLDDIYTIARARPAPDTSPELTLLCYRPFFSFSFVIPAKRKTKSDGF